MRKAKRYEYDGKSLTADELAKIAGCSVNTMRGRLYRFDGDAEKAMGVRPHRIVINVHGEEMTPAEAAERYGLRVNTIWDRLSRGITGDDVVSASNIHRGRTYDVDGVMMSVTEMARKAGVTRGCMQARLLRGMTPSEAVGMGASPQRAQKYNARSYEVDGERMTVVDMSRRSGISTDVIYRRIVNGMSPEMAMHKELGRYAGVR